MNRSVRIVAWGVAGAVLTGALTAVAVSVAGHDIATPVRPLGLTNNRPEQPVQEPSKPHEPAGHDRGPSGGGSEKPGDDQGGDSTSGSSSGSGSGASSSGSDEESEDSGVDHDGDGGDDDD